MTPLFRMIGETLKSTAYRRSLVFGEIPTCETTVILPEVGSRFHLALVSAGI
jgi:hypothetical protein